MRLLIVRHGDPDYEHDTLTEKGWREAELLSERLSKLPVKEFYVSPLGRAKDTASLTLQKMNREAMSVAQGVRHEDRPTGLLGSKVDCLGLAAGGLDERRGVLPA